MRVKGVIARVWLWLVILVVIGVFYYIFVLVPWWVFFATMGGAVVVTWTIMWCINYIMEEKHSYE